MTITRIVLFIVALVSGFVAMFSSNLLSLGGVTNEDAWGPQLVLCGSAMVAVMALAASAFLKERKQGFGAVCQRTLILLGVCGITVSLPFVILSGGELGTSILLLALLLLAYVFFPKLTAS